MSETPSFDPQSFKDFEHAGWERSAANYHALFGRITAQANESVLKAAGIQPGTRVLDVPCGSGDLAEAASVHGSKVVGLDFSASMLTDARARYSELDFRQGDAENLPFENRSFDAVLCHFGMLHFPHPDKAITEALRVLAPGGRYVFTVWCPPEKSDFFQLITGAVNQHADKSVSLPAGPPMFRFADPEESKKMLLSAGFVEPETAEIPTALRCLEPGQVLDVIYKSIVRMRALLEAQPAEAREKIEHTILEGAESFRKDGEIVLTMPALMASARKP